MPRDSYLTPYLCDHGIIFDEEEAQYMTVSQIREFFPRLNGECPL